MTAPTWHLERAKVVLDEWYSLMDYFNSQAQSQEWSAFSVRSKWIGRCKRDALKCKTLGLIYHDKHKLLLEDIL